MSWLAGGLTSYLRPGLQSQLMTHNSSHKTSANKTEQQFFFALFIHAVVYATNNSPASSITVCFFSSLISNIDQLDQDANEHHYYVVSSATVDQHQTNVNQHG